MNDENIICGKKMNSIGQLDTSPDFQNANSFPALGKELFLLFYHAAEKWVQFSFSTLDISVLWPIDR